MQLRYTTRLEPRPRYARSSA